MPSADYLKMYVAAHLMGTGCRFDLSFLDDVRVAALPPDSRRLTASLARRVAVNEIGRSMVCRLRSVLTALPDEALRGILSYAPLRVERDTQFVAARNKAQEVIRHRVNTISDVGIRQCVLRAAMDELARFDITHIFLAEDVFFVQFTEETEQPQKPNAAARCYR